MMVSPTLECTHYKRNCDKKAPCCGIFYPCRLCHDAKYVGEKSDVCKTEIMDRYNVTTVRCRKCRVEQPVSNKCVNCEIEFAKYFCPICKLYDDDQTKDIYHCDKCKMCRRGKYVDNVHCDSCGICLSKVTMINHQCLNDVVDDGCPVCLENLKISTKYILQLPNCPHYIHQECYKLLLVANKRNCPICCTPMFKMEKQEIEAYDQFAEEAKKMIPESHLETKVTFYCMDCKQYSKDIQFNYYLKCAHCGSYNTKQ